MSFGPTITGNGQFIAFASDATNLVAGDTNAATDVFLHDRDADGNGILHGEGPPGGGDTVDTSRVSVSSDEAQANGPSDSPSISQDGMHVAFTSRATNLVAGDDNGQADVFVRSLATGTTIRVSHPAIEGGVGDSSDPSISADGRFVAFTSDARLVAEDQNAIPDVYVFDRDAVTNKLTRVSSTAELDANAPSNGPSVADVDGHAVVAFTSQATNLIADDGNGSTKDVFVWGASANIEVASVRPDGRQPDEPSSEAVITPDGSFVVFTSEANDLLGDNPLEQTLAAVTRIAVRDTNDFADVYLRDLVGRVTSLVSVTPDNESANGPSVAPSVSADGAVVAFRSSATDLVKDDYGLGDPADTNGHPDVFVRDLLGELTDVASVSSEGEQGNGASSGAAVSASGRYIAFQSFATIFSSGTPDTNGAEDVFVRDRQSCNAGTRDDGPVSGPIHTAVEPNAGRAGPVLHDMSCQNVVPAEQLLPV